MTDTSSLESLRRLLQDRYVIERELGRGGMAAVYLARDVKHERAVAIKVLSDEVGAALGAERFLREIKLTAQLPHPHILPIYDSGNAGGRLFYVMPFVEGESVRERLKRARDGRLPVEEAVRIASEVADALDFAHRQGIVHRDVKPENILLEADHAVIADFGIARALTLASASTLTETGTSIGTPAYMSPEQIVADRELDGRSDIYSLGCVLYEMLGGALPFTGPGGVPEILPRLTSTPRGVRALRPDVPSEIEEAVTKALEPKPSERFASAAEFRRALVGASRPRRAIPLRKFAIPAAAVVVLGVVAAAWSMRTGSSHGSDDLIAVLPFKLGVADSSLTYMREGMGILLENRLNGDAGVRVASGRSVMSVWRSVAQRDEDNLRNDQAVAVGKRVGASDVLVGSIVGTPRRIEIQASLLSVETGVAKASVRASGPADSVEVLADTLAAELLSRTAGEEEQRLPVLKHVPLPALRAYLDGHAVYRKGRFADAVAQFQRALEIDSTFVLAAFGYVLAANYSTVGDESPERALRIAWNGRGTLSMRDRAYVVARAGASYPAVADLVTQVQGWHNAVKAAPDRAEAWYQLGEQQFLYADFLTEEDSRAQAAKSFEKALSLDSTFTPALERLVELRARSSDTAATRRLIPLLASRQSTDRTDYVRWRAAIALGDSAGVRALRARLPRFSRESITQLFQNAQLDGVGLGDAIQAVRIFSDRGGTADEQGDAAAARYLLALNRGQPHAAAPDLMRAAGTRNYVVPLLQSQAVRDAIWSSGDTAAAVEAVDQLSQTIRETVDPTPADDAPLYVALCAVEQWNLAHGDTRTATAAISRLKAITPLIVPLRVGGDVTPLVGEEPSCPAILEATLAAELRRTDAEHALERLDSLLARGLTDVGAQIGGLTSAKLHEARGDYRGALDMVRRRPLVAGALVSLASSLREEGHLAELVGDRGAAIRAYQHYLALRVDPEPALVPEVAGVQAALRRLQNPAVASGGGVRQLAARLRAR